MVGLVMSATAIATAAAAPGLNNAVAVGAARDAHGVFTQATRIRSIQAALAGAAMLGAAIIVYFFVDVGLGLGLGIAGALLVPAMGLNTYTSYWQGSGRFYKAAFSSAGLTISVVAASLAAAYITRQSTWTLLVYFSTTAVWNLSYTLALLRQVPARPTDDALIAYGRRLTVVNLISAGATHLDRFLTTALLGPSSLGLYLAGAAFPDKIRGLTGFTNQMGLPTVARASGQAVLPAVTKVAIAAVGAYLVMAVPAGIAIPWMLPLLFGDAYAGSVPIALALLAIPIVTCSYQGIVKTFLPALGDARLTLRITLVQFMSRFVAIVLFVPKMGIWGLVIACACSEAVTCGIAWAAVLGITRSMPARADPTTPP